MTTPVYLTPFLNSGTYASPREANKAWFKQARYGLFLHYGLYSLLGRHEWVQLREKISVAEYAKLKEQFTAENFDAELIAQKAKAWGMQYINITTRHHECFCLFETKETDFNSLNSPAKRDLVKELAEACERHGLGLFLYYTHGRDWRHPHAPHNEGWGGQARPQYDRPDPDLAYGDDHDLEQYLSFMERQIKELLDQYPTIAGIWLDGIAVPLSAQTDRFRCQELYDMIYGLSEHALVSYKQGVTGTEDFFAPEHRVPTADDAQNLSGKILDRSETPIEICTTMINEPNSWGYYEGAGHKTETEVWEQLQKAAEGGANLLLNTGPLPDGSLDPQDVPVLDAIGERLAREGFPDIASSATA